MWWVILSSRCVGHAQTGCERCDASADASSRFGGGGVVGRWSAALNASVRMVSDTFRTWSRRVNLSFRGT